MFKSILKSIIALSFVFTLATSIVSVPAFAQTPQAAPTTGANTGTGRLGAIPNTCAGGVCPLVGNPAGAQKALSNPQTVAGFILSIAQYLTYVAAAVAVVFMVWGGYKWMDVSDAKGAETGKRIVVNAAIGLAVAILAGTIVAVIGASLQSSLLSGLFK
jgi:Type IV secretion system pilin